jgi:hypothetical protein
MGEGADYVKPKFTFYVLLTSRGLSNSTPYGSFKQETIVRGSVP